MKNLIKILFAITLCLPLTLSAQHWSGTANTTSTISRTGKVTIDNTTTVRRLHIKTNTVTNNPDISLSAQAMIETESNMFLNIDSDNDTDNAHFTVGKNSPTTTGYTPLFRIRESGNVGVGRTNPLQKLDVAGNIKLGAGADAFLQNTTGYIGVRPADATHGFIIRDYTGQSYNWSGLRHVNADVDRLEFSVMNNDYGGSLVITQNKRVGIGTTDPTQKLHVEGNLFLPDAHLDETGNFYLGGKTDNGEKGMRLLGGTINGGAVNGGIIDVITNTAGEGLLFRVGQSQVSERMRITAAGNVGIGTTSPDNKLDVNGVVRAKEVKVEEGWSDYVFYDDYDLPTLEEEEKHIEANGHLLGFESEKAMAGEIELGDVSKRQQAKIEEIILHLIEINKEVTELKEENKQLKKQLDTPE